MLASRNWWLTTCWFLILWHSQFPASKMMTHSVCRSSLFLCIIGKLWHSQFTVPKMMTLTILAMENDELTILSIENDGLSMLLVRHIYIFEVSVLFYTLRFRGGCCCHCSLNRRADITVENVCFDCFSYSRTSCNAQFPVSQLFENHAFANHVTFLSNNGK